MAILFAAAMGFVMLIDYVQLNNQIMNYEKEQTVHAEKAAISSLRSIDKASSLLEQETSKKMEEASLLIQEKYEENPHFKTWDFEKLKRTFGMDIYIIDKDSTIVYSSEREEIGMNFAECCGTLNEILEERRETGQLYIDDIDIQKNTGQMKKFSYMATNDKNI